MRLILSGLPDEQIHCFCFAGATWLHSLPLGCGVEVATLRLITAFLVAALSVPIAAAARRLGCRWKGSRSVMYRHILHKECDEMGRRL